MGQQMSAPSERPFLRVTAAMMSPRSRDSLRAARRRARRSRTPAAPAALPGFEFPEDAPDGPSRAEAAWGHPLLSPPLYSYTNQSSPGTSPARPSLRLSR